MAVAVAGRVRTVAHMVVRVVRVHALQCVLEAVHPLAVINALDVAPHALALVLVVAGLAVVVVQEDVVQDVPVRVMEVVLDQPN